MENVLPILELWLARAQAPTKLEVKLPLSDSLPISRVGMGFTALELIPSRCSVLRFRCIHALRVEQRNGWGGRTPPGTFTFEENIGLKRPPGRFQNTVRTELPPGAIARTSCLGFGVFRMQVNMHSHNKVISRSLSFTPLGVLKNCAKNITPGRSPLLLGAFIKRNKKKCPQGVRHGERAFAPFLTVDG